MNLLKSGTLDLALLSALDGPPRYGLEILQHVNQEFPDFSGSPLTHGGGAL